MSVAVADALPGVMDDDSWRMGEPSDVVSSGTALFGEALSDGQRMRQVNGIIY